MFQFRREWHSHTDWSIENGQIKTMEVTLDAEVLSRDDGFIKLIRFRTLLGPADDGPDRYRYVEGDISFDFSAERRVGTGLMTDTWEVRLDPNPRRIAGLSSELRSRLGPARCSEVLGNI